MRTLFCEFADESVNRLCRRIFTEGRREGRQQGREEGLNGTRKLVLRLLQKRFGTLSRDAVKAVNDADPAQLDEAGEALVDETADLSTILALLRSKPKRLLDSAAGARRSKGRSPPLRGGRKVASATLR